MERKEWLEIKDKVSKLHVGVQTNLKFLEENAERIRKQAGECNPRVVGWLSRFSQFTTVLRKDAELLRFVGILSEDDYQKFTYELQGYHDRELEKLMDRLETCICAKGAK